MNHDPSLRPPNQIPEDEELIESFLAVPEGYSFDCKRLGKLDRVLETIIAFANADGGIIALGLEDPDKANGRDRIYGVQENALALDELKKLVRSRITPEIHSLGFTEVGCRLRSGQIGGVCFLKVPKSPAVHSIVNDGTFRRVDRSNQQLTAHQINELSFARGAISAESQLVEVDMDLLQTPYWDQYAAARKLTRPPADALRHIGLAKPDHSGVLRPTRAAVLLFAEDPAGLLASKASVRLLHYKGDRVQHSPTPNLLKPPKTGEHLQRRGAETDRKPGCPRGIEAVEVLGAKGTPGCDQPSRRKTASALCQAKYPAGGIVVF